DRLTHDHLGLSATVGVGSVDEVDPGIKSTTDDAATIVMAGVAPRPEHHRAEGVFADRHAGATQDRAFHDSWSSPAVGSPTLTATVLDDDEQYTLTTGCLRP